jgi:hypothetical protein
MFILVLPFFLRVFYLKETLFVVNRFLFLFFSHFIHFKKKSCCLFLKKEKYAKQTNKQTKKIKKKTNKQRKQNKAKAIEGKKINNEN